MTRWWQRSVPIAINEGGRGFTLSVYRDGAIRVYLAGKVFWPWGKPVSANFTPAPAAAGQPVDRVGWRLVCKGKPAVTDGSDIGDINA